MMLMEYTWRSFVVVEIRIDKIQEMSFYLIFSFVGFRIVNKRMINLFKGNKDFRFANFICLDREV